MFDDIVWSTTSHSLKNFIHYFSLPQLVKVGNGLYSEEEAKTLSAEQILTLHYTKRTDKVLAKAGQRRLFCIPVNFPCKVEILPTFCQDRYYSVQDIVDETSIKFVRVVHDSPPSFGLRAGDILKLVKTVEENREKYIVCEFHNKTRDVVKLPLAFKAAFDPLAKSETYHFQEVLNSFKLPVRVKFTSCDILMQGVNNEIDLLTFDSVLLKTFCEESTIIATSRWDNTVTVVMIPTDLDVTVHPAEGAINGDKTYARFCREIHDGADLQKVDLSLSNSLRLDGNRNAEVLYDYVELRPCLPPRGSTSSLLEVDDDSPDDYVEMPPPRPPKPAYLQTPPLSPTHAPPQQHRGIGTYVNMATAEDEHCPSPPVRTTSLQQCSGKTPHCDAETSTVDIQSADCWEGPDSDEDYLYPVECEVECETPQTLLKTPPPTFPKPARLPLLQAKDYLRFPGDDGNGDDDNDEDDEDKFKTDDGDFDDFSGEHDYFYPQYPTSDSSAVSSTALEPQPSHGQGKKNWISKIFKPKKVTPKSSTMAGSTSSSAICTSSDQNYSITDFPDDLSCVSVTELSECLKKLNLERHVETFYSNQIDGQLFMALDEELLSSLGVVNAFEQKKIMKFINGWRPRT